MEEEPTFIPIAKLSNKIIYFYFNIHLLCRHFINYIENFIDEIGLKEHLSPTRANGLVSMVKKIKMYALAFDAMH